MVLSSPPSADQLVIFPLINILNLPGGQGDDGVLLIGQKNQRVPADGVIFELHAGLLDLFFD